MRRSWSKQRTQAERMATRDRALQVLLAAGFKPSTELPDVVGVSKRQVYASLRRLAMLRGGPIEPDPEFEAAVNAFLDRVGMPRAGRQSRPSAKVSPVVTAPPAPSARERVASAIKARPGAGPREIADAAGVTLDYVKRVLTVRASVRRRD